MRQLIQIGPRSGNFMAPAIPNDLIPHDTTETVLVKETETVITRERTYSIVRPRPVCPHCGKAKERVIGAYFECVNDECPSHDPAPATAIPMPAEGKNIIDVIPVRRAA